ncbi:MAG: RNA methyltransferase [Eubacterium sp.]|nr:RNA methyltransferase [Eubacterium sp.]
MGEITVETISSKSNTIIKDTKKLLTSSSARQKNSLFVLEGARLCFDVLNSVYRVRYLLLTQKAMDKYADRIDSLIAVSDKAYIITDEINSKLSDTATPQGIYAVCEMTEQKVELKNKVVALDRVQDPSNVGALIRTAEALGIDSIILYDCCDIYNPKALRASMGSVLRLGCVQCDSLADTLNNLKDEYKIYSTVPQRDAKSITEIDFTAPSVCVIGNEANGVEENIKALSDELITIPMLGRAESLNAGVAGAITMWEMMR